MPDSGSLCWVRAKLSQWGRWCRAEGIGYPTMSSTEQARIGHGGAHEGRDLPEDLQVIDLAVTAAPPHHKLILVEHYTKRASVREHAARLNLKKSTYFDRKDLAEAFVNRALT